jgi:hypothetical protein
VSRRERTLAPEVDMPEEGLETQEIREKMEEAREHAESGPSWLVSLSLSTALLAVVAAIAALQSGALANAAIVEKNDAVLSQAKADDAWSYFQAKSIKATIFATQAEVAAANPELAARFQKDAAKQKGEQEELKKQAEEHEKKVAELNVESAHSLHRHHLFATSVTIFQVAIALAAIAALTRKQLLWWVSLVAGAGGLVYFARGFGVFGG